ncbi:hypothetical protein SAMN02744124_01537 [Paenibacillus barengoltzii J12]|jgi:hypothetical protein|uniref:Uncharacterized protein n=1 Tax=Paenibacillus barengoltzii J12 TaxID=935846 RepID=A0ABY1LVR1_9BACL|nr:hypothetical protein SAMN02744124_01537 [Paenibacillus barengoltzii J12]
MTIHRIDDVIRDQVLAQAQANLTSPYLTSLMPLISPSFCH